MKYVSKCFNILIVARQTTNKGGCTHGRYWRICNNRHYFIRNWINYNCWIKFRKINKVKEIIEFANIERVVITGVQEEITTLNQATDFLLSLGYIVEEM